MKLLYWATFAGAVFAAGCDNETVAKTVDEGTVVKTEQSAAKASDNAAHETVRVNLQKNFPIAKIDKVMDSGIPGIYMVAFSTGEVLYVNEDVSYMLRGELYKVDGPGRIANQTEAYLASQRETLLAEASMKDMITYGSKGESKGEVFVFTDVDCGYCRKFHQEIPRLNELGITVNYLAWPRAGEESQTGEIMSAVWCADDQLAAMTKAKFRDGVLDPADSTCKTPIAEQLNLGRKLGVRGTPAVFLKDGKQVGGYLPADDLAKQMGVM